MSIKYNDCLELLAAAHCRGIETYAIQHGDHYANKKLKRLYEWPVKNYFVWSKSSKRYHNLLYPEAANYININSILWHERYKYKKKPKKINKIIFFESCAVPNKIFNLTKNEIPKADVKIKRHPYYLLRHIFISKRLEKNCYLNKKFVLWKKIPKIGVSFESTITDELLFLGVPVVTITKQKNIGIRFPNTGSFSIRSEPKKIILYIKKLYNDKKFYSKVLAKQKKERKFYITKSDPTQNICDYLINKNNNY